MADQAEGAGAPPREKVIIKKIKKMVQVIRAKLITATIRLIVFGFELPDLIKRLCKIVYIKYDAKSAMAMGRQNIRILIIVMD